MKKLTTYLLLTSFVYCLGVCKAIGQELTFGLNFEMSSVSHGSNLTWNNGALTASAPTNNWLTIHTFSNEDAAKYTGLLFTSQGEAARLIVCYTDDDNQPQQVIKTIDAASEATETYLSWSMIGVPAGKVRSVTEIRLAGKQDYAENSYPSTTTFTSVKAINYTVPSPVTVDDGYAKFNNGSCADLYSGNVQHTDNVEWILKRKDGEEFASLKTTATYGNGIQTFGNGTGDGASVKDYAKNYTGLRIDYQGSHFRVIVYTSDNTSFIYSVPEATSKTSLHLGWEDFGMTSEDVSKITGIWLFGCNVHATEESVDIYNLWLYKMYHNTIWTLENNGEEYNLNDKKLTYSVITNGNNAGTVVLSNCDGNSRADCGGIKLNLSTTNNTELNVTPPTGYVITKIRIGLGESSKYDVSFNSDSYMPNGTSNVISYDKESNTVDTSNGVRLVIRDNQTDCTELHITYVTYELKNDAIDESRTAGDRPYWIYVPHTVKENKSTAYPVVFSLHGAGGDYNPNTGGAQNFKNLADQEGFIVIYPQGTEQKFPGWGGTTRGWAATGTDNADIEYFKTIISALKDNAGTEFTIDPNRIYITGFSNGGMMTYAAANAASDVFAAFASISGFPVNEMHLQHNGPRAVPFLHIHGKSDSFVKYSHATTIIDNMVARNGLSYTPTTTENGTGYDYYAYEATDKQPYYFYAVDGMGHSNSATINGKSNQEIIWDFFKSRTLNTAESTIEFAPDVTTSNSDATNHGWTINSGMTIAQYGESGGYTTDGENVYHSIQLKAGTHWLNFKATNSDETKHVIVKLVKLGTLDHFSTINNDGFAIGTDDILMSQSKELAYKELAYKELAYYCKGEVSFSFVTTEDAEFQLIFVKGNENDATVISDISITTDGTAKGAKIEIASSTDFTGYFNYHNRLSAQWNFDSCDKYRFNEKSISSDYWAIDETNYNNDNGNGTKLFTYKKQIGSNDTYSELTYDNNSDNLVAVTAGLKFYAPSDAIKIQANYSNGTMTGVHLIVNENVKMFIPYVENSYLNDLNEEKSPSTDNYDNYKNCVHHWKRDILYFSLKEGSAWNVWKEGTGWTHGHLSDETQSLFGMGGEEYVDNHHFYKLNYRGETGSLCVVQFYTTTVFNRIGINRNLTYSFYSEYLSDLGSTYTMPLPRMRIIGTPTSQKVANIGSSSTSYTNAIAFTYGGWKNTSGSYSYYRYDTDKDNKEVTVTDSWGELSQEVGAKSAAVDGFSVISQNDVPPTSESLMPSNTEGNTYHEACTGKLNSIDGTLRADYIENFTPWTLPCRGAYLKFEPTIPGVLNVNVFQKGGIRYYIVDEFGKPITDVVYHKSVSSIEFDEYYAGYKAQSDCYIKYSLNVYPGKTYYMLSPEAGIGFAGFYFEPFVYRTSVDDELGRKDIELKTLTLNDGENYSYNSSSNESKSQITSPGINGDVTYDIYSSDKAVAVTLNRSFKANTWNSICLPFSMNNNSMEMVFGKGTKVILLRDIQDGSKTTSGLTTANFIRHENQDIIAGYPYLIYPTQDVESIKTNACIAEKPSIPTINSVGFKTTLGTDNYDGITDYDFTGTFSTITSIPAGSYYMNKSGNLARTTKGITIKPYRAYLANKNPNGAKALGAIFLGNMTDDDHDTATGINNIGITDVITDAVNTKADSSIYNMQGQKVGDIMSDLYSLPKGVYIIHGRKYIIK